MFQKKHCIDLRLYQMILPLRARGEEHVVRVVSYWRVPATPTGGAEERDTEKGQKKPFYERVAQILDPLLTTTRTLPPSPSKQGPEKEQVLHQQGYGKTQGLSRALQLRSSGYGPLTASILNSPSWRLPAFLSFGVYVTPMAVCYRAPGSVIQ